MVPLALAIATSLGAGYVPIAPGTVGSAVGLILWALLPAGALVQIASIVALFVAGSWAATVAETHFQRTDPGQVVIDEVMGMLITLALIPVGWWGAGVGFLLFRLGYIPAPGDSVTHGSHTFSVQEMDRNRIAKVKIVTQRPAETNIEKGA